MRITTWGEYGLIVSLHLARRAAEGPTAARVLAEHEGLPHDYVEQILLRMRRAGVVVATRGAHGGYALARAPEAVTVRDVLQATELATFEVNCDHYRVGGVRCRPGGDCAIRPVWRQLEQRINGFLGGVTLADLLRDEPYAEQVAAAAGA
jgi:Rrf2 family protein